MKRRRSDYGTVFYRLNRRSSRPRGTPISAVNKLTDSRGHFTLMTMQAEHLDLATPKYEQAAAEIRRGHERNQPEANITSAVRDSLVLTRLTRSDEIVEEIPPSDSSRRAVDLTTLDTFIKVKRRLGSRSGFSPDPGHVKQLDDYLEESERAGKGVRMGILTDGKRWLLRWPGAGEPRTVYTRMPSPWNRRSSGRRCSSGCETGRLSRGPIGRWTERAWRRASARRARTTTGILRVCASSMIATPLPRRYSSNGGYGGTC